MQPAPFTSKPHYLILDALRGIAAIMVVIFHIFEAHASSRFDQIINHGYLAVDFFFLLSGYVIGYAYDDRWGKMTVTEFFKRRLIRLQPMVIIGMLIGAICFYFQDSIVWPGISEVPVWKVILIMLIGFTLIPVPVSMDIRGWSEMHPLDGPGWSLFFEYIANIFYALFVRKFSTKALWIIVVISGLALIHFTITSKNGDVIGGWALEPTQLRIGFTRMMFPFFAGLLLCRLGTIIRIKHAFIWSSLLIILMLSIPRLGSPSSVWINGLYESFCIIIIFPLIVLIGAGANISSKPAKLLSKFCGDISYPIYITHYPIIYIYTAWVANNKIPLAKAYPYSILLLLTAVLIAYISLKLYDEPVRTWLKNKIFT